MHILLSSHIVSYKCQVPIELQSIDTNWCGIHGQVGQTKGFRGHYLNGWILKSLGLQPKAEEGSKTISLASIEYLSHRRMSIPIYDHPAHHHIAIPPIHHPTAMYVYNIFTRHPTRQSESCSNRTPPRPRRPGGRGCSGAR